MITIRLFCCLFVLSCMAQAQEPTDPRAQLAKQYEQEKSLLADLSRLDNSLSTLQQELKNLTAQKETIAIEQLKQQQQLKNIGGQIAAIESRLIQKTNLLYKIHRRGLARIIFGAESPVDLRRRSTYLQILIESDKSELDAKQALAKEQKSISDGYKRNQHQLDMLEENLTSKKQSLQKERSNKQDFLATIQQEKSLAMQLLKERQAAQTQFTRTLPVQTIDPQPQTVTQVSQSVSAPRNFADTYGSLRWPLNGTVLRRFGKQKDPISGQSIQSNGIDIQAPRGTRVNAVYDGVVALAKFIDTYGQTVVVNHGRYSTVYAHLSGLNVKQGQRVSAGTTLGMVGNSGITDAQNTNWLSFEIRYNKTPQDPLRWLKP